MILSSAWRLVAALFVTAALPMLPDARAQTPSTLTGTIRDDSGAIVAGGTLTLDGASLLGEKQVTATNALGRYRFPNLPPGPYELTASGQNLESVKRTVRVPIGSTLVLDFVLGKAEASSKITLVNAEPMIDVTSAASSLIAEARVVDPPSAPRSVITPFCHRNACQSPVSVNDSPMTWPASLISYASALKPPSVPRSVIAPFRCHRTA